METINLSPLQRIDTEFQKIATTIEEHFRCDWDDNIHDSYGRYVSSVQQCAEEIRSIRCKAETLVTEEEALDIEGMKTRAATLCREADAI